MSFHIDEPVVLVGAVALALWLCGERLLELFGLHQPKADKRERLSWYWLAFSFYSAVVFAFVDATVYHWSTVGPALRPGVGLGSPWS